MTLPLVQSALWSAYQARVAKGKWPLRSATASPALTCWGWRGWAYRRLTRRGTAHRPVGIQKARAPASVKTADSEASHTLTLTPLALACQLGFNVDTSTEAWAEGATYAAALLPLLRYCDSSSGRTAATIVAEQMALGSPSANFVKVKNAVEQSFQCLGITCVEVGGLWDANTRAYRPDAAACVDSQQSQTYIEVYTPIAGYSPGGNVVEHNEVDLDQKAMEAAETLEGASYWYAVGGNSQKSGGKLRTIQGFSTDAKKKSAISRDLKPSERLCHNELIAHAHDMPCITCNA